MERVTARRTRITYQVTADIEPVNPNDRQDDMEVEAKEGLVSGLYLLEQNGFPDAHGVSIQITGVMQTEAEVYENE